MELSADFKEQLSDLVRRTLKTDNDFRNMKILLRRKAQQDLWFFNYHVCNWRDITTKLHVNMCERWQARSRFRFSINLIPRSHLKTSLWTVGGTLHDLVQDWIWLPGKKQVRGQDLRFLIVNAKLDNAVDILRDIESIVVNNEMFAFLFPEYVPDESWQRGRGKGSWITDRLDFPCSKRAGRKEGNIEVMSVGASLVSKHYDKIVFDDPVNEDNVTTKPYRDKIDSWYRNALQLRNDPITSQIRLIGTRWHFDDLYGRLIKKEKKRRDHQREQGQPVKPVYFIYRRKAIENGEPIWPERFTKEELLRLKTEELGSYIYSCQYDNDPLPEEDAYFKLNDIRWIDDFLVPEDCINFAAVDMADEETTRGDFTAITVGSFDSAGNMYVRQIHRGKFSHYEIIHKLMTLTKHWDLQRVGIETTGFQKGIVRAYKHEAEREGWFIPWVEITRGKTSKLKRGLGLQPRVERGDFYIVNDIKNAEWLIEEMTTFPLGVNDDILDTVVDLENIYYSAPKFEPVRRTEAPTFDDLYGRIDIPEEEAFDDTLSVSYLQ